MKRKITLLFISILLLNLPFKGQAQAHKTKPADQIAPPELIAPVAGAKINIFP